MSKTYKWKFATVGGATRVKIESGEDIRHLSELDQKMWTVLSCPTSGLEIDARTLPLVDLDQDGKIQMSKEATNNGSEELNISALPQGVYIVKVGTQTVSIIKL